MTQFEVGDQIFSNFEVLEFLGAGSLMRAYRCQDSRRPTEAVVVKILGEDAASTPSFVEQLHLCVSEFKEIHHPNVVQVFELLQGEPGVGYVTEFMNSGDLVEKIEKEISPIDSCKILIQIARGLQAIHDHGFIHRNLKPEKILLDSSGTVKIAESSVGRRTGECERSSGPGVVATISYIPPEYMLSSQIDERSDIYGIGILGYELLTRRSPFSGGTVYETMRSRLKSSPIPPSEINRECPAELGKIILQAMHQDPNLRFQSAAELEQALMNW